jgi:hypothetical protein
MHRIIDAELWTKIVKLREACRGDPEGGQYKWDLSSEKAAEELFEFLDKHESTNAPAISIRHLAIDIALVSGAKVIVVKDSSDCVGG